VNARVATIAFAIALIALPVAANADDTAPSAGAQPWEQSQALLKEVQQAVQAGGIRAIEPRAAEMEKALASAQLTYQVDDTTYVLTDGIAESIVAMAMVTSDKSNGPRKVVAVDNPYPGVALYLGSYYDEIGKPDQGVRVLDAGLSLSAVSGIELGESRPMLLTEKGEALVALKRAADALAVFDEGLKIDDLEPHIHAHLHRGRGFALTELGRLDEAEEAYRASLRLEPDNSTALHELAYIASLRKGANSTVPALQPLQPPSSGTTSPPPLTPH
jgi:tetratricopeptide (TPR) repeat protein